MQLEPGTTLGHYEIVSSLGAGGMGEVYRALDSKLGREVAIKLLLEEVSQDPERLARFEREARLLASLNHSNIATLHGFETEGGTRFLVMELVDGETLAERVATSSIPVGEALELALQISEGIEAAHAAQVVHRDLKPGNIMVRPDGRVKLLDFGLAKALSIESFAVDPSMSPTLTQPMTRAGQALGTPVYMSPEQVEGRQVDKQADIWAFGCAFYEMLTGRRAFDRPVTSDDGLEPDWEALPVTVPPLARSLMRRCLRKDLRRRFHDIADVRVEIEEAIGMLGDGSAGEVLNSPAPSVARPMVTAWTVALAAAGIGIAAAWVTWKLIFVPSPGQESVVRLGVSLPPGVSIDAEPLRPAVAISSDGRWLVFVGTEDGTRKLFKRSLERFETSAIPGTDSARFAFFSPDDRWVGFWDGASHEMKKVALAGGSPVTLCKAANAWGATWGTNGKIVFPRGDLRGLWQVSEAGGEPELLLAARPDTGDSSYILPEFLPDGQAVLFSSWRAGFTAASAQVQILDLSSGETEVLLENAAPARYLETGHLLFGRGGRVEVVAFDLQRREIVGSSVPVPEPIFYDPGGKLHAAVSDTGTLVFVPGRRTPRRQLVTVDLSGNQTVVGGEPRGFEYPRFSPEGERLVGTISELGEPKIWIVDSATGLQTRLAGEGRRSLPVWSPDGRKVAFAVETDDPPASWSVFWQEVGASSPEPLIMAREPGEWLWPASFTPNGKGLVFARWLVGSSKDLWYASLENVDERVPVLATEADEENGILSPDGRWIAYASDETGRWAIYVQRFPEGGERHQVSTSGARSLAGWAPDARTIYYAFEERMMAAGISTTPRFQADTPRPLFELRHRSGPWYAPDISVSTDGERFVFVAPDPSWGVASEIRVVLNWLEEVKRLVPTN